MRGLRSDASALIEVDLPVEQVLPFIVQIVSAHMISEFGLRIYRVSVGEAERFPSLAQEYYESGPVLLRQQLVNYLEKCIRRGELKIPDLELAADQLIELASVTIHDRALFLSVQSIDKEMLRKVNDQVLAQGKTSPEVLTIFKPLTEYMGRFGRTKPRNPPAPD